MPNQTGLDVRIENHGSVYLLRPLSERAREWLEANVDPEAQYFGNALCVEPRYIPALVEGMIDDGLLVE